MHNPVPKIVKCRDMLNVQKCAPATLLRVGYKHDRNTALIHFFLQKTFDSWPAKPDFLVAASIRLLQTDIDVLAPISLSDEVNMKVSFGIFEDVDTGQHFVIHERDGLLGRCVCRCICLRVCVQKFMIVSCSKHAFNRQCSRACVQFAGKGKHVAGC